MNWDATFDVIVVGSGFAGLAAAIEARAAGSSVLIVEKMKGFGGNSTISDGVIAAAGTAHQSAAGIADTPKLLAADMRRAGLGLNHPELVETVARHSADVLRWTTDALGVTYYDRIDQFGGHSVPRCHTPLGRSGAAIVKQLLAKVRSLRIPIRTCCYLERILASEKGSVVGLAVRQGYVFPDPTSGMPRRLAARKAVVLASGGFGSDVAFRSAQDPRLDAGVGSTNKFSATGEALREAMRIGAMPVHLSWIQLGPWASPDEKGYGSGPDFASYIAFPYGLMVDPGTGRRVVNELADRKLRAETILGVGRPCIAIADQDGVDRAGRPIEAALRKAVVMRFQSLEKLADHYAIPSEALQSTVTRFNRFFDQGRDADFGKPILAGARPLRNPPFYGMRLWPKVHYTMGGVRINAKAQVLDLYGEPIQGFFAAGEVTGGVHGACRLGSCAITDCLVFGRIAGRQAAMQAVSRTA
jgi:flavocytochrome c